MQSRLKPHKAEIKKLLEKEGYNKTQVARKFGVPRTTLRDFLNTELPDLQIKAPVYVPPEEVQREEVLESQLKEAAKALRKARTQDVQAEAVLGEIREVIKSPAPRYKAPKLEKAKKHKGHIQALMLSDLHAGEVVEPEAVNGMNEYNWAILEERMSNIHRSLASFASARPYPIEELQLWFLGDMCSGSNHDELVETNEFSAAEQGFRVGHLLGQWTEALVKQYPKITIHGVPGNHPRLNRAPSNKNVFNNFDWMAYKIAETYLSRYETVTCNFPRAGQIVADIAGLQVLLFHGDGIRSSMPGVPWGGVVRRVNELRKQYLEQGVRLDGFSLGHFHNANAVAGNVWMNGSVKGPDEYSIKNFGSAEQPRQLLLTFSEERKSLTDVSFIDP